MSVHQAPPIRNYYGRQVCIAHASLKQMDDSGELEQLYARHGQALFAFVLNLTRHEADTCDILQELFAVNDDPDEQAFRRRLAEALGQLPPDQRAVVHLKLWEDLTFDEISRTLGIPANTAASRYRYGLDKLRARLRPLYNEINEHTR